MPVKVRCTGCKKVLNAPDAARGKAIKCPHCQAKVRVPGEKGAAAAGKKPAAAKKGAASAQKAKKKCFTCGKLKRPEEFHKSDKTRDGRLGRCKKCISEYRKAYIKKHQKEILGSQRG